MKVLVIGGTGIIGTGIVDASYKNGHEVYAVSRKIHPIQHENSQIKHIAADWRNDTEAKRILNEVEADVVVDGLVFGKQQLIRNLNLLEGHCKHYIYISTSGVYGHPAIDATEDDAIEAKNLEWSYAANKKRAEEYLLKHKNRYSFMVSIIRPPFTYGDTRIPCAVVSRKNQWTIVDRIIKHKPIVFTNDMEAKHAVTHISIFADAIVGIFMQKDADGQAFHVSQNKTFTWDEVIKAVAKIIGEEPLIVHVPVEDMKEMNFDLYTEIENNKKEDMTLNNDKIKKISPNVNYDLPLIEGLANTVVYLKENYSQKKNDREFDNMSDLLILKCNKAKLLNHEKDIVEAYVGQFSDERINELTSFEKEAKKRNVVMKMKKIIKDGLRKVGYYG